MTTVAEVLKQERETQGISLEEVAQKTYIKLHYLHALEEDRPDLLPAPVYTCGYIRQYAKLLGLNGADLVNIYQSQHKPREYSIVRNVSPALTPETKPVARPVEAEAVEAIPAAVRHTEPVETPAARPVPSVPAAAAFTASEPKVTPAPAAVVTSTPAVTHTPVAAPAPAVASTPVATPSVSEPVTNGSAPKTTRYRAEEPAPFNPSLSSAPAPRGHMAAETVAQPLEVRIDTRDALLSHPEAEKILALARQQADDILAKARDEAAKLRQGAEQYADQILAQLETDIGRTLAVIKNGRSHLQGRSRARRPIETQRVSDRAAAAAEASAT